MSSWLSTAEGLVAAAIPVVGLLYTYTTNRRSQYERVLTLTAQVSTPPIADDRHVAGTAFEPLSKRDPSKPVRLDQDEIKALFNVLWYFQRADAVYVSLRPPLGSTRITRVQALLLDTLASPVGTWKDYLALKWVDITGERVNADDVTPFLEDLAREYGRLQEQRARRRMRWAWLRLPRP
jgi:hypothetical protein